MSETRTENRGKDEYRQGMLLRDEHGFYYIVTNVSGDGNKISIRDIDGCRSTTRSLEDVKAYFFPVDQTPDIILNLIGAKYIVEKDVRVLYEATEQITEKTILTGTIRVRLVDSQNIASVTLKVSDILHNAENFMAFKKRPHVEELRNWTSNETEAVTNATFDPGDFENDGISVAVTPTGG